MERVVIMVNGRSINDELNRISQFFENLDCKEFEKMLENCGEGIIEESCQSSYVLVTNNSFRMEKCWKEHNNFYQNVNGICCNFSKEEDLLGAA